MKNVKLFCSWIKRSSKLDFIYINSSLTKTRPSQIHHLSIWKIAFLCCSQNTTKNTIFNQLSYVMANFLHNLSNNVPIGRCQEMFFKSTLCCQIFKFEKLRIAIYLPGRFFPLHFYASVSIQAMHHLSKSSAESE